MNVRLLSFTQTDEIEEDRVKSPLTSAALKMLRKIGMVWIGVFLIHKFWIFYLSVD